MNLGDPNDEQRESDLRGTQWSVTLRPSKYYKNLQYGGVFLSFFLAGFFFVAAHAFYTAGGTMSVLIVLVAVAMGLGMLMIAVYYLSDMFMRKIIVTDQAILDQRGFPLGSRTIPRSLVHACRIEIAEHDKVKPGLENVRLSGFSWIDFLWSAGWSARTWYSGALRGYAKQQSLILLGSRGTTVGEINCFGFEDRTVARLLALLETR